MSVLEQLNEIEKRVISRLKELQPLVAEYQELEEVAQRLGLNSEGQAKGSGRQSAARTSRPKRIRGAATTGTRGKRQAGSVPRAGTRQKRQDSEPGFGLGQGQRQGQG